MQQIEARAKRLQWRAVDLAQKAEAEAEASMETFAVTVRPRRYLVSLIPRNALSSSVEFPYFQKCPWVSLNAQNALFTACLPFCGVLFWQVKSKVEH
jgi:hypothetical protein